VSRLSRAYHFEAPRRRARSAAPRRYRGDERDCHVGAWRLRAARSCEAAAASERFDAIVAWGCVIRGETAALRNTSPARWRVALGNVCAGTSHSGRVRRAYQRIPRLRRWRGLAKVPRRCTRPRDARLRSRGSVQRPRLKRAPAPSASLRVGALGARRRLKAVVARVAVIYAERPEGTTAAPISPPRRLPASREFDRRIADARRSTGGSSAWASWSETSCASRSPSWTRPSHPSRVVIDEAVKLAHWFAGSTGAGLHQWRPRRRRPGEPARCENNWSSTGTIGRIRRPVVPRSTFTSCSGRIVQWGQRGPPDRQAVGLAARPPRGGRHTGHAHRGASQLRAARARRGAPRPARDAVRRGGRRHHKVPLFLPTLTRLPFVAIVPAPSEPPAFAEASAPLAGRRWGSELPIPGVQERRNCSRHFESTRDDLVRRGVPRSG